MRSVLVTGATGLIGRRVLTALREAGDEITAVSRRGHGAEGVETCDLTERAACSALVRRVRPDSIVHLAGGTADSERSLYANNVLTTVHLIEAYAEVDVRPHLVVLGSAAEYGHQARPIRESSPTQPVSDYGRAKLAQTALARLLAGRSGMPLTVLRPFNVVARDLPASTALGNLVRQVRQADQDPLPIMIGRTDIVRDYVAVETVVAAIGAALDGEWTGRTVNVCSGKGVKLSEIVLEMGRRLGVTMDVIRDPVLEAMAAPQQSVGDPALMARRVNPGSLSSATLIAGYLLGQLEVSTYPAPRHDDTRPSS